MSHISDLTAKLKDKNHPAASLGEVLIHHSNNPAYLVETLGAFLAAAQRDKADNQAALDAAVNSHKEEERQQRIAAGEALQAPEFQNVELHLNSDPDLPKRRGKAIKAIGGKYRACRGYNSTRIVFLPWNEEGQALFSTLLKEYGQMPTSSNHGSCAILRDLDTSSLENGQYATSAAMTVYYLAPNQGDPVGTLMHRYRLAFSKALKDGKIKEKVWVEKPSPQSDLTPVQLEHDPNDSVEPGWFFHDPVSTDTGVLPIKPDANHGTAVRWLHANGYLEIDTDCETCDGTGKVDYNLCPLCKAKQDELIAKYPERKPNATAHA